MASWSRSGFGALVALVIAFAATVDWIHVKAHWPLIGPSLATMVSFFNGSNVAHHSSSGAN